jgi:hypothetical protein
MLIGRMRNYSTIGSKENAETLDAITRLSDEANENDEYHTPVPLPEVWNSYKRLSEQPADEYGKWTQDRIGEAKGVSRQKAPSLEVMKPWR